MVTLPEGTRLGPYRIVRMIGDGGMGFVYEAVHTEIERRAAIKMLRPELAQHKQVVARFLNEARAVNLIKHQNIVDIYEYSDRIAGNVYFVMEFLDGETLDDVMRRRRPMQVALVLHVFGQIAKALAAAHAKQVVHRDLKPSNVYVIARESNPYYIKLLDFGIAQLRGPGALQGLTLEGAVIGTPQYMSPEQISAQPVDARCDIWALGVMMYRATTGQAPFKGDEFVQVADQILHHSPKPAAEIAALPPSLSQLIESCLARRVEDRCGSASELIDGLERVKQECKLDDAAILAAVTAESTAVDHAPTLARRDSTRDSVAGSLPRFQGAGLDQGAPRTEPAPPPRRSRLGLYLALGAAAGALASATYVLAGRDPGLRQIEAVIDAPTIEGLVAAGDVTGGQNLAKDDLLKEIGTGTLQHQGFAVDALAWARAAATVPLLYAALRSSTDVRVKAAHALGDLALPDAAPKLAAAFATTSGRSRIDLAIVLVRLGDRNTHHVAVDALTDPTLQLGAAIALAETGDPAGRDVLDTAFKLPPERKQWRDAAGALLKLGDATARRLLQGELAHSDPQRALGAAELLARTGDAPARELLARTAADPEFARRGDAALALARLGDKRGLAWVATGLASTDPDDRKRALAICSALPTDAARHTLAIATLATTDPDLAVRMTAEAVLISL